MIWLPDLVLINAKEFDYPNSVQESPSVTLNPAIDPATGLRTGRVDYVTKNRALVTCPMQFQYFPADVQVCSLTFRSCKQSVD